MSFSVATRVAGQPAGSASDAVVAGSARIPRVRRYLMCEPTHFTVAYSINPWMDPDIPVCTEVAIRQWAELKATFQRLGHTVETIDAQPGLPDMVFAANAGTVIDGRVLGARFRASERAEEAGHYRGWFERNGYPHVVMPSRTNEAEGDLVWTGRLLLAGTGFRTDRLAHAEAQEVLGVPVVSLDLVDPSYYHLDTALVVLDDRPGEQLIAYYPAAFSAGSRQVLARLFPDAVLATEADAACFGLNAVSDGRHVVLPVEATGLARRFAERGFEPVFVDISELRKAGGGPKCCTMELRE